MARVVALQLRKLFGYMRELFICARDLSIDARELFIRARDEAIVGFNCFRLRLGIISAPFPIKVAQGKRCWISVSHEPPNTEPSFDESMTA